MAKYITVGNLKSWIENWQNLCVYYSSSSKPKPPKTIPVSELEDILEQIEQENVAPVIHARWIKTEDGTYCSNCELYAYRDKFDKPWESDYCPYCGAKMDGGT